MFGSRGSDSFFERLEETLDDLDEGQDVQGTGDRSLSLPDEETLARVFSTQNLQLISAITQHNPSSMRDLAKSLIETSKT